MIAAVIICALIMIDVLPRRGNNSEIFPFVVLLAGIILWIIAALAGLIDQNISHKLFWAKIEYFGVVSVPLSLLIFILFHTGVERQLIKKLLIILSIIPALTLILAWTNGSHGLIWKEYSAYREIGFTLSEKVYGPGFWFYWIYSYIILLVATVLTFQLMWKSKKLIQWQSIFITIGILAPWIGNLLYVLQINPLDHLDLTPIMFSITGIMLAIGLFRWRLIEIKPIAYFAVIKNLKDGVVVLDFADRIVDLNPSALKILDLNPNQVIGEKIKKYIPDMDQGGVNLASTSEISRIFKMDRGERELIYEITDSPFFEKDDKIAGRSHAIT